MRAKASRAGPLSRSLSEISGVLVPAETRAMFSSCMIPRYGMAPVSVNMERFTGILYIETIRLALLVHGKLVAVRVPSEARGAAAGKRVNLGDLHAAREQSFPHCGNVVDFERRTR